MNVITPARARRCINRAEVFTALAEVHTTWGEAAWNAGDYPGAVRNWQIVVKLYAKAEREGGER